MEIAPQLCSCFSPPGLSFRGNKDLWHRFLGDLKKRTMRPIIQISVFLILCLPLSAQKKNIYMEGYDRLRFSVERISVSPGTEIELTLKTVSELPESQMAHNFVLLEKQADVDRFVTESMQHKENGYIDPELTGQIIAETAMLGGGETDTITFTAPAEKGKYIYVCTFPGHYVAGMKGTLIVE